MPPRLYLISCGVLFALGACGSDGGSGDGVDGGGGPNPVDAGIDGSTGPQPDGGPADCTFTVTGNFDPDVECAWEDPAPGDGYPGFDDVVATPVVINLTDDNDDDVVDLDDIPDIAFITYPRQTAGCPSGTGVVCNFNGTGVLRVVSGGCVDGTLVQHYVVGPDEIEAMTQDVAGGPYTGVYLDNSSSLAVGDIDNDGSPDIVAMIRGGGAIAFEKDGSFKWINTSHPDGDDFLEGPQPSLANAVRQAPPLEDYPEVIIGRVVLRGDTGERIWGGTAGIGTNAFMGPVSALADLDRDGELNILAGNTIYTAQATDTPGTGIDHQFSYPVGITSFPGDSDGNCQDSGFACDGFTAAGNFDSDDEGEVAVVRAGVVYIFNHDGTPLMVNDEAVEVPIPRAAVSCDKPTEGGPPTIADFDGDGEPELATAGADFYIVVDLECFSDTPPAQCDSKGIRWKASNDDCSSRITGSSVFDFDGDGAAEVIYNDEEVFRIFDGSNGTVRIERANASHTRLEMPIVADVDNDGNAEIVFVENAANSGDAADVRSGLRVWGDTTDSWVATRRIWNQHSYHVTNVSELGEIPATEPINWLTPTPNTVSGLLNNFRQNLPDFDISVAPDLTVTLTLNLGACSFSAFVCNEGDINVGAGASVSFYDNDTQAEIPCQNGPLATTGPLAPGACETVACVYPDAQGTTLDVRACVDNADYACSSAGGGNNECNEGNNQANDNGTFDCQVIP